LLNSLHVASCNGWMEMLLQCRGRASPESRRNALNRPLLPG
jgi:hypothetical protein